MNLPRPSAQYDSGNEAVTRNILELEDKKSRKIGADVEIGKERLILKSPDGTRWNITIDNAGTLSASAL